MLDCPDHPSAGVLKLTERKNDQSYISAKEYYCNDSANGSRHHQAFKSYYCNELLGGDVSSEFQVMEFLKTSTLMDAVNGANLHKLLLQTSGKSVLEKMMSLKMRQN